jgi:hypothetical protein
MMSKDTEQDVILVPVVCYQAQIKEPFAQKKLTLRSETTNVVVSVTERSERAVRK